MSGGLVREVDGRIVFGDAVVRAIDALHPLGQIGRMIAESGAIARELRQLSLEGKRVEYDRLERMARLEQRDAQASATVAEMRAGVRATEDSARRLRQAMSTFEKILIQPGLALEVIQYYGDIYQDVMEKLIANHDVGGKNLNTSIDTILNGAGALEPPGRREPRARPRVESKTGSSGSEGRRRKQRR